ncbi:hypothetical protein [Bradyrhizobium oligotrophicum]|uniref:hypothetical protein n=1 Tax=Bradyrhizobium oligotrophicum TaxID=44255 RepID=UPI003EBD49D5
MPELLNKRREAFCRAVVLAPETGMSLKKCYETSGYATKGHASETNSSRLLRFAEIERRIAELRAPLAAQGEVTMASLLDALLADRELARRLGQPSAAIKATGVIAALCGFLTRRQETGRPGEFSGMKSASEVLEVIRAELGDDAAAAIERAINRHAVGIEAGGADTKIQTDEKAE